ncbi:hypothetical protein NECID01_1375 [Nematocida sp. AWRm77]|nr:hypothetical protein NECID01_1375 [Nematocida sp. AWRm77]
MAYNMVKSKGVKFIDFTEEIKRSLLPRLHPKKPRIKLEEWQVAKLIEAFEEDTHPSNKAKKTLAHVLSLPIKSVQIWFQNKRAKEKSRIEQEETENERSPYYGASKASVPEEKKYPSLHMSSPEASEFQKSSSVLMDERRENMSMNMSYDKCYHIISSSTDFGNDTVLNDDPCSFIGLFSSLEDISVLDLASSQIGPCKERAEKSSPVEQLFAPRDGPSSTLHKSMEDTPSQYRLQFRNGSIIYNKDQEKTDFFNEVFNNMNNLS